MEWLIWILVAFALFRLLGFSCAAGRIGAHRHAGRPLPPGRERMGPPVARVTAGRTRHRPEPVVSSETPMESLQRRFVDGRITVEQYEAELDRLFARAGHPGDAQNLR